MANSNVDVTIDPKVSFQSGAGTAADATPESLDTVRNIKCFKGVDIRNSNGTAVNLLIGYRDSPPLYELPQGEKIFLEVRFPGEVKVSGDGDTCDYTFLAY